MGSSPILLRDRSEIRQGRDRFWSDDVLKPSNDHPSPKPKSSLARQLAAWLFALSFVLLAVTATILSWGTVSALNWADDQVAEKRLETVRTLIQDPATDSSMIAHEVSEDNQGPRQIFIRILADDPEIALATPYFPEVLAPNLFPDASQAPLDSLARSSIEVAEKGYRLAASRVALANGAGSAIIQVAIDTSQDKPALRWYRTLLATVLSCALALSAAAIWFLVRRKLAPLHNIAHETTRIRSTTLDKRLDLTDLPAELYELGQDFNAMLARLEHAYIGLRQYSDDIAHELRSPLNRMMLSGEVTLARDRPSEELKAALAFNMEECRQLVQLIETLHFVARAENKQMALHRERVDIADELNAIIAYFEPLATEAGISLALAPLQSLEANVDRMLCRRAVSNVVANAIAHTPPGGRIDLSTSLANAILRIDVSDTGKGIAPEDLPHVFDRFYRGDKARSFGGGRVGLGLAIVKSIVELHGGTIAIESALNKGTRVTLMFSIV
jgi:two-component system heavy metal sensor histidine kinase CusS